jgi:hypothetical protein
LVLADQLPPGGRPRAEYFVERIAAVYTEVQEVLDGRQAVARRIGRSGIKQVAGAAGVVPETVSRGVADLKAGLSRVPAGLTARPLVDMNRSMRLIPIRCFRSPAPAFGEPPRVGPSRPG